MVKFDTTITEIVNEGPIKPRSPLFSIINDSHFPVWIDNYKLNPNQTFNIDAGPIVAEFLNKEIPVTNETTYNLKFDPMAGNMRKAVQLVELIIKKSEG